MTEADEIDHAHKHMIEYVDGETRRRSDGSLCVITAGAGYSPVTPSIRSRSRSAWPLCRAYSSIMCR
jgi:hypothetical protein